MKIAITITDFSSAVHIGGDVERKTVILEIPDSDLPAILKQYFRNEDRTECKSLSSYTTLSFSLVIE